MLADLGPEVLDPAAPEPRVAHDRKGSDEQGRIVDRLATLFVGGLDVEQGATDRDSHTKSSQVNSGSTWSMNNCRDRFCCSMPRPIEA